MNTLNEELRLDFLDKDYAHDYVDEFLNASIATQIKAIRQQRGLSQEELADLAGMKQERISVLEDVNYGSWSIKTLRRLARAFDVTLKVSFETFGVRIDDIVNFSRQNLERDSRKEELLKESAAMINEAQPIIDMMKWAKDRNRPTGAGYLPLGSHEKTKQETPTAMPPRRTYGPEFSAMEQ